MPTDWIPSGLSPLLSLVLLGCSMATSLITATLGAGGGVMLLAIMASILPPVVIIPVHGLVQLGSNLGRAVLTWRFIDWRTIGFFLPGAIAGAWIGSLLLVQLPGWIWYLSIAAFILYICWGPALPPRALGPAGVLATGALTTFASLFVGSTGPLVAAYIKQIHRRRFGAVATFATAMTLQHAPKALVFGALGFQLREWLPFILAMVVAGAMGTWIGLRLLRRIDDRRFHLWLNGLLTLLALRLVWLALY